MDVNKINIYVYILVFIYYLCKKKLCYRILIK